ncbi:unnamed protein product [Dovyalis caffra]|uniref:Histone deacetylase interacting domain-containing protein n=1 Tax=Dovyalis caffra TaxID=77055 RepID=A0AAV1R3Z9_9ROSI|nr:unnamed protein product [Dovyalis caffra]
MKRQRECSDDCHSILFQFPREEVDAALNYARKLKAWFRYDQPAEKIYSFGTALRDAMDTGAAHNGEVGRLTIVPEYFSARVKAILGGNRDLIYGFNSLMPPLYQISLDDEEKKETEATMESQISLDDEEKKETEAAIEIKATGDREMDFMKKMGSKRGQDGCEELLKNFNLCKEGSRSFAEGWNFGRRLTDAHPDLQSKLLNFIPITEPTPVTYSLPKLQSSEPGKRRVDELQKNNPESFEVCKKKKESELVKADGSQVKGISLDDQEEKKTEATTESKTVSYRVGMDFVNKLKIKCGEDGCKELLKNINLFKKGSKNLVDVYDFSLSLTKDHPDLQKELIKFMSLSELENLLAYHLPDWLSSDPTNTRAADELQKKSQNSKETKIFKAVGSEAKGSEIMDEKIREGLGFLEEVKKRLPCEVSYKNFLKLFFYYTKGKIGNSELKKMVANLIGKYPDLMDKFNNFWSNCDSVNVLEVRGCKERDKRREKHRNKSGKYRKEFFECEDERYQLDMLLEWLKSAITYVDELGRDTLRNEEKNGSQRIFLRCIERLYGDQGVEILEIFNKDPQRTLPVLRLRLLQKLEELIQFRQTLKK